MKLKELQENLDKIRNDFPNADDLDVCYDYDGGYDSINIVSVWVSDLDNHYDKCPPFILLE